MPVTVGSVPADREPVEARAAVDADTDGPSDASLAADDAGPGDDDGSRDEDGPGDDGPGPVPPFAPDPARAARLLRLRVLLKTMVAVAFCVVVFVVLSVFLSDDGEENTLPGLRVVVGDMAPGETRTLSWDGRAVIVHRRTPTEIARLEDADGTLRAQLRDPDSTRSEQPAGMDGALRSADPEWFVAIGLGTDYGCPIAWLPPEDTPFAGLPWPGGFVDSCGGSRYDLAGRVYDAQYSDRNLVVPPHTVSDGTLLLGG